MSVMQLGKMEMNRQKYLNNITKEEQPASQESSLNISQEWKRNYEK